MLSLDVAISTYQPDGILRVEKMLAPLSIKEGVRYIVSWQEHQNAEIPLSLITRGDVEVYRLNEKGLSNNRNNALAHCRGDIILIADDDLIYQNDFAERIIDTFQSDPSLDLAIFKIDFLNKKSYPASSCILKLPFPKNYYVTSMEIAFRRISLGDLRFYPELGLGSKSMHCGEEEMFVASAIRRNKICRFINLEIASHSQPTTGDRINSKIIKAQGFIISLIYGMSGIMRMPIKAFRIKKYKKYSFFKSIIHLSHGSITYHLTKNKIPKRYRW